MRPKETIFERVVIKLHPRCSSEDTQRLTVFIHKSELDKCFPEHNIQVLGAKLESYFGWHCTGEESLCQRGYRGSYISIKGVKNKSAIIKARELKAEILEKLDQAQEVIKYPECYI